jgi:hypothetical protein
MTFFFQIHGKTNGLWSARFESVFLYFLPFYPGAERETHTQRKKKYNVYVCLAYTGIHWPFFYFQTIGSRRTLKKKRVHRGEICIDGCEKWFSVISLIMNYTYKRKRAPPNNETCSSIRCYYLAPAVLCIGGSV